jgi:succinate-semialdehyde dehydrogenase/glutarate-semialdehyde dehydrogenase
MTYPNTRLLINGSWVDAKDKKTLAVINPANGDEIGRVAYAGKYDLDKALLAAQSGFEVWSKYTAVERSRIMRKAASRLREQADQISLILTQEQGKPLAEAKVELMAAVDVIVWMAVESMRIYGRIIPSRNLLARQMVTKEPVGPVAAFTPWNFPVTQVVRKLSAALATGCSIIIKASEETPASPAALVQAFLDAGIPNGVIGLVYGDPAEISNYLITDPIIRKVSFTGSTAVGKQLASLAGSHMKRVTMELGGHAPVIICDDADIDLAVKAMVGAKFRNAGQVCISPSRFYVQKSVSERYVEAFTNAVAAINVGDGLKESTKMGPLANTRRLEGVQSLVNDALTKGGNILTGGNRIGSKGNFFEPTVINNISIDARLMNEEPFGPVAAFQTFEKLDDVIREANRLPFGLSSYAFTRSLKNSHQLAQNLKVGMLWVNQGATPYPEIPFGGVNDSGYGSEGGFEALEAYLITKSISIMNV